MFDFDGANIGLVFLIFQLSSELGEGGGDALGGLA